MNSLGERLRRIVQDPQLLKPLTLLVLIAFLLVAPSIAVCFGNNAGAAVLAVVGATAIVLTRLEDLTTLSLFGALTAQLKKAVTEAEVTISQLRQLAGALAEVSLTELARSGQIFGNLPIAARSQMRDRIVLSLRSIGTSEPDIQQAQRLWTYVMCQFLEYVIVEKVKEVADRFSCEFVRPARQSDQILAPDVLRQCARDCEALTPEISELLNNYEHLARTGEVRNPSVIPSHLVLQ